MVVSFGGGRREQARLAASQISLAAACRQMEERDNIYVPGRTVLAQFDILKEASVNPLKSLGQPRAFERFAES
jgi:hypothetical protein